jgi:hypothetical protein
MLISVGHTVSQNFFALAAHWDTLRPVFFFLFLEKVLHQEITIKVDIMMSDQLKF